MRSLIFVSLLAFACGSSKSAGSFTGTVHGQSFTAVDAESAAYSTGSGNTAGFILIANTGNICADAAADRQPPGATAILITVADVNTTSGASTAPTAPGTYTVSTQTTSAHSATFAYNATDQVCNPVATMSATATSGTVILTSASSGAYSGTFDVTLDSGDHVTGTFEAASCSQLGAFLSGSQPTCG